MLTKLFNTASASLSGSRHSSSTVQSAELHEDYGVCCTIEELAGLKLEAAQLKFPLRHKSKSHLNGAKASSLRGRGIDFDEVRAYQPGDEIRSIDWRVTARTGQPHTKIYKEEKEKPVYVLLDMRSSMFFGSKHYFKSVTACHIASLLAWSSLKNGDRFGALIFSDNEHEEIKPKTSTKSALGFLNLAANYSRSLLKTELKTTAPDEHPQSEEAQSLASAAHKLFTIIRPGSLVYIISDFHDFDDEVKKSLSLMSRHNDLIALQVLDPLEQKLPQSKRLLFTNTEAKDSAVSEIQGQQKKVREEYQQYFKEKHLNLEQQLLEARVPCINVSTATNAFEQLQLNGRGGK